MRYILFLYWEIHSLNHTLVHVAQRNILHNHQSPQTQIVLWYGMETALGNHPVWNGMETIISMNTQPNFQLTWNLSLISGRVSNTLSNEETVRIMTSDPESIFRRNMLTLSSRNEDNLLVGKPSEEREGTRHIIRILAKITNYIAS